MRRRKRWHGRAMTGPLLYGWILLHVSVALLACALILRASGRAYGWPRWTAPKRAR